MQKDCVAGFAGDNLFFLSTWLIVMNWTANLVDFMAFMTLLCFNNVPFPGGSVEEALLQTSRLAMLMIILPLMTMLMML